MADRNLQLALRIRAAVQGADNIEDLRQRFDELIDELQRGEEQANETDRAFGGLQSGIGNVGDALQTLAGLAVVQQFVQINRQAESLRNTLTALFGSTEKSAQEIQYLNETANRLGVAVSDISQSYIGLTTASKGTNLEGQKTREIFEAVIGAMAVMGKTGQEADQALTAIAQTMGKGVIQAEELTGQLEEALPGASRALAAALGITVAELRQMVATGTVVSADVLPALAAELKKTYGASAEGANTLNAQLARLQNAVTQVFTQIGESGALQAFKEGSIIAAVGVRELYGGLELTGTAIGALAAAITTLDFSQFNRTMQETSDKLTREVASIAQFSDTIGPAFAKSTTGAKALADAQGNVAGKTAQAGQAADQAGGSLAKLSFSYAQLNEKLEKTLSLLDQQAAQQQAWIAVHEKELELRGDIVRQTQYAIDAAQQDMDAKRQQAIATGEAADRAQEYVDSLREQANVLPDVLDAAEKDAVAKRKEADSAAAAAATASQHAEAVRAANTVILDALGQQGESAESARAKAAQLRAEYEALKAAGAPLSDLASKMDEVVRAEDAARVAARGYREEQAITIQQLDQLKSKLDGSLGSQVAYNTALDKYAKQQQTAADQTERRNRLMEGARQADIAATRAAADLAEARGQEAEAARLRNVALEQELSLARDRLVMQRQEQAALQSVLEAKEREADTDKVRTLAEQEGIQAVRDLIAEKKNEIAATEAAVTAKQAEIETARQAADAKEREAEERRKAAEAAEAEAAAIADAEREARRTAPIMAYLAESFGDLNDKGRAALDAIGGDALLKGAEDATAMTRAIADLTSKLDNAAKSEIAFGEEIAALQAVAGGVGEDADRARQKLIEMAFAGAQGIEGITRSGEEAVRTLEDIKRATEEAEAALAGMAADFRKQILQIKGDQKALLDIEYQDNLRKLEELHARAGELGREEYEQAKAEAEALHRLQLKQLKEQEEARNNQNAPATTGGHTTGNTGGQTATSQPSGNGAGGITVNVNANNARLLDSKFVEDLTRQIVPALGNIQRRLA